MGTQRPAKKRKKRWRKCITKCFNCFCISWLEFECNPLLPALVWSLLACLWGLPLMVNISFQNWLYLSLILESLVPYWWRPHAWSSSQLVALNWCIYFWITWPYLFVCLWIPSYFIPLWWKHWNFLYYMWDKIYIALVYFFWTWWYLYWYEHRKNHLDVSYRWLCISWKKW